jgi:hypothetical protein
MNYRERYVVGRDNRQRAVAWANSASSRYGLFFYQMPNVIRVEASSDLSVLSVGNSSGKSPVHEEYVLAFNFASLGPEVIYLRKIDFSVAGKGVEWHAIEWHAKESANDPPARLEDFLESASPVIRALAEKGPVFYEMYEGIYSRLFPFVEHEDVHSDNSSSDYE